MQKIDLNSNKIFKIINNTMATKTMTSLKNEDSFVGYSKLSYHQYYTEDSDEEYSDDDDFYDHYEPYEEEFDNGEYQPFNPEEEEREYRSYISPTLTKVVKPFIWMNSPTKSAQTSPTKCPTWWDKNTVIEEEKRTINGVLNYGALLPPPTPKPKLQTSKNNSTTTKNNVTTKKNKKSKGVKNTTTNSGVSTNSGVNNLYKSTITNTTPKLLKSNTIDVTPNTAASTTIEVQKPTRFCLSIIKHAKCFHKDKCRFAHEYSDLKECNFGDRCKKITVVKTNPDGTLELKNKNTVNGGICSFKHAKESKNSYLNRVPQQHTSPKRS
jgi:hypothetical protein